MMKNNEGRGMRHIILAVIIGLCSANLQANVVERLYEAVVPVKDQSRDERSNAIRLAFTEVLIRVSGQIHIAEVPDYPAIQTALQQATRYAQQFRYVHQSDSAAGRALWVRFDENAVNKLLHDNQLPVWSATRPATIAWLVVDNHGRREIIGNNQTHPAQSWLKQRAKQRGLPLNLPLLDLTDRGNIRVSDIWGNFEDTILDASHRYQTEAVLVGRIFQTPSGYWQARWTLYNNGRRNDWSVTGAVMSEVIDPGIDSTAQTLAERYAHTGQSQSDVVLVKINDVKGLKNYSRVYDYLSGLSAVTDVQPLVIKADSIVFRLTTRSGRLGVARAVSLGHTLISETANAQTQQAIAALPGTNQPTGQLQVSQVIPDLVFRLVP